MAGSRMLERREILQMIRLAKPREKVFVLLGIYMGTRISEALALNVGDIRGKKYLTIQGKKKGDNQQYPIPPVIHKSTEKLIAWYRFRRFIVEDHDPLFLSMRPLRDYGFRLDNRRGIQTPEFFLKERVRLSNKGMFGLFKDLVNELRIPGKVSPHGLRKAFITSIYDATGKDIVATRVYSRHKSLTNLQYYINASTDTKLITALNWENSEKLLEEEGLDAKNS